MEQPKLRKVDPQNEVFKNWHTILPPDGARIVLQSHGMFVPDPLDPGKGRSLTVTLELCVRLEPEAVEFVQNPPQPK